MIDTDTSAAGSFYREVRRLAETIKPWETAIRHYVLPDEVMDLTLISQRVYGRRDEYLAVMASAGLDTVDQPVPITMLVLPTESQLYQIKRRSGFESIADYRENFAPTWAEG